MFLSMTLAPHFLPGRGTSLSGQKKPVLFVVSPLPTLALGIKALDRECVSCSAPLSRKFYMNINIHSEGKGNAMVSCSLWVDTSGMQC